jgi:diadenosine tetraphosphate (Ap4A) HIT family hydrolase
MSQSAVFEPCVFCDIVAGNVPASVVYRDNRCLAFMDIRPVTPGHLLVIPLAHSAHLADLDAATGGHLFVVAQKLAAGIRRSGLAADGINFFLADGEAAGQEVFHVHLHVFPRFRGDGFGLRFAPEYGQPVARERLDSEANAIATASGSV